MDRISRQFRVILAVAALASSRPAFCENFNHDAYIGGWDHFSGIYEGGAPEMTDYFFFGGINPTVDCPKLEKKMISTARYPSQAAAIAAFREDLVANNINLAGGSTINATLESETPSFGCSTNAPTIFGWTMTLTGHLLYRAKWRCHIAIPHTSNPTIGMNPAFLPSPAPSAPTSPMP
jgi:hypothetical protein